MHKYAKVIAVGTLAAAPLVAAPAAYADVVPASVTADITCGKIELTLKNPNNFLIVFDYSVDNERPRHRPVATGTIAEGPYAGKPWPARYNLVSVDGRVNVHEVKKTLTFKPWTGDHKVMVRAVEGGEQKAFMLPETFTVKTNCGPKPHKPGHGHDPKPTFPHRDKDVRPADPTVQQPRCSHRRGYVVVPNTKGLRYVLDGHRVLNKGRNLVTGGKHVVKAQAVKGYEIPRGARKTWQITVFELPQGMSWNQLCR